MRTEKIILGVAAVALCGGLQAEQIRSFRDAGKIRSWDAWHDHESQPAITNVLQNEKPCVTFEKLRSLDPGLKEIGLLRTRTSAEISSSKWSVDCGALDRDYADWTSYRDLLPMLGVKHARFFCGWAKTEQQKGVLDFGWLDAILPDCAARGVKPWGTLGYGNPNYGSDFRLGMRVKQLTDSPEGFAAWLRFVRALVGRYKGIMDEWEIWNEPFGQGEDYATLFYETAKAIREVQPEAKIISAAILHPDIRCLLEKLKRENALGLVTYFNTHPYHANPDENYDEVLERIRRIVREYSPHIGLVMGESGCPSNLEFAHALRLHEWTEYSQAKWDLRRAIGDGVRGLRSSCFHMTDLQYTFMLQSFGLVRSNTLKEFVYRRPKWFAMRNVYALIDDDVKPVSIAFDGPLTCAKFERGGRTLAFYWFADGRPSNDLRFEPVRLDHGFRDPVWVEMITGRVFELGDAKLVPLWDAPVLVAEREAVPLAPGPLPKFGPIPTPARMACGTPEGRTNADGTLKRPAFVREYRVDGRPIALPEGTDKLDLAKIYPEAVVKGRSGDRWAEVEFAYRADTAGYRRFKVKNDHWGEVYLNGAPICETQGDFEIPLDLKAGDNTIRIRTRCGISGGWAMSVQLP